MAKPPRNAPPSGISIKKTRAPRYQIKAVDRNDGIYQPVKKNPIHSVLTALPILMLVAGLYIYYRGESAQSSGVPILAESIEVQGLFTGVSTVSAGADGQHFLWIENASGKRGIRVQSVEMNLLAALQRGVNLQIRMAPTVPGSSTYWAWHVEAHGDVVISRAAQ